MAAGLAHEIRNPLAAIKGAIQLIVPSNGAGEDGAAEREPDPEATREFLGIILDEVNRLNGVVTQFLDYSRPLKTALAPGDVNDILQRTLKLLSPQVPAGVTVAVDLAEDLPRVNCDPEQLKQVFLNLAINAIQAMPEGGTLHVQTGIARDEIALLRGTPSSSELVEIRFRDTGPGIPDDARDHLFVPFYTTKEKGTGLGLAICQRIIGSHGGSIGLRSAAGEGAEFVVALPAIYRERVEAPKVRKRPSPEAVKARLRRRRRRRRKRPDQSA
jgi:signal transduction histidine kinase